MYGRVHVLDVGYQYSGTMDWQRASWLAYIGKAEVLVSSDVRLRHDFFLPRVIRIMKSVRKFYKHGVPWSRENLFIRDDNTCVYCGKQFKKSELTVDHVHPRSRGGTWDWKNTATSCKPCNNRKDDKTPHEAGMHFYDRSFHPSQPTVMEFFLQKLKMEGLDGVFAELGIY